MEVRPKLNDYELDLLIEAMVRAGYKEQIGTDRYEIWFRFTLLRSGLHAKRRLYRRSE